MNKLQSNILSAKTGDIFVSTKYGTSNPIESSDGEVIIEFVGAKFTLNTYNFTIKNYLEGMVDFMGLVEVINTPSITSMFSSFLKLWVCNHE